MNCWETLADRDPPRQWQQQDPQKSTVSDLVYGYLNKMAEQNCRRKQRNNARDRFRREHAYRKKRLYSPICLDTRGKGTRRETLGQKSIRDKRYPSTDYFAADYAKAVDEGKNRRKLYVRKALSFGVDMGYLSPIDPKGRAIRVSPALGFFYRRRHTPF